MDKFRHIKALHHLNIEEKSYLHLFKECRVGLLNMPVDEPAIASLIAKGILCKYKVHDYSYEIRIWASVGLAFIETSETMFQTAFGSPDEESQIPYPKLGDSIKKNSKLVTS